MTRCDIRLGLYCLRRHNRRRIVILRARRPTLHSLRPQHLSPLPSPTPSPLIHSWLNSSSSSSPPHGLLCSSHRCCDPGSRTIRTRRSPTSAGSSTRCRARPPRRAARCGRWAGRSPSRRCSGPRPRAVPVSSCTGRRRSTCAAARSSGHPQPRRPVERQRCGRTATRRAGSTARTARPAWPARSIRVATSSAGAATSCSCSSSSRRAACSSPPPRGRPRCCTCSRWRSSRLCGYVYLLAQLRQREQVDGESPPQYKPQYQPQYVNQPSRSAIRSVRALLSAATLFSSTLGL